MTLPLRDAIDAKVRVAAERRKRRREVAMVTDREVGSAFRRTFGVARLPPPSRALMATLGSNPVSQSGLGYYTREEFSRKVREGLLAASRDQRESQWLAMRLAVMEACRGRECATTGEVYAAYLARPVRHGWPHVGERRARDVLRQLVADGAVDARIASAGRYERTTFWNPRDAS